MNLFLQLYKLPLFLLNMFLKIMYLLYMLGSFSFRMITLSSAKENMMYVKLMFDILTRLEFQGHKVIHPQKKKNLQDLLITCHEKLSFKFKPKKLRAWWLIKSLRLQV